MGCLTIWVSGPKVYPQTNASGLPPTSSTPQKQQSQYPRRSRMRHAWKVAGGGSVRPKSNIFTYNQSIINPFCLYPQIYPRSDAEFQRSVANASDLLTSRACDRSRESAIADKGGCGPDCPLLTQSGHYVDAVRGNGNRLRRLARDHSFGPGPARNRRRSKDREISVAVCESIEADLAISYGCKLTAQ
jgi:hypothetical protein